MLRRSNRQAIIIFLSFSLAILCFILIALIFANLDTRQEVPVTCKICECEEITKPTRETGGFPVVFLTDRNRVPSSSTKSPGGSGSGGDYWDDEDY